MAGLLRSIFNKLNTIPKCTPNFVKYEACLPSTFNLPNQLYSNMPQQEEIDPNKDRLITECIIKKVNQQVTDGLIDRLFAVVHIAGKQFKVTDGDLLIIEGYWPPTIGDKISLDKILMVGAKDFTLIGRPLIQSGLANVHATVIEKTLSHTKTHFRKKRRKQYKRIHFYRIQQTMLRINKVEITGELNNPPDVTSVNRSLQ